MAAKFDCITIEGPTQDDPKPYVAYGHGVYEDSSVLAGQDRRVFLDYFDTLEDAVKAYPDGELGVFTSSPRSVMPSCAPSDFDPYDAGECWGEDDY